MFRKVLIAEDHEMTNISVRKTLEELGVDDARYVYYCDDALSWISKAVRAGQPYELLITDLSFEEDNLTQVLKDGEQLIRAAKDMQPSLKIIVFSAESRSAVVDKLFKTLPIDGYVRKARRDAQHLKQALQAVYKHQSYLSPDLKQTTKGTNTYEFSEFDIAIISLLAQGLLQKDIPIYLQQKHIKPSSLSSVEKRLNAMKEAFGFSKNEQLVAYCKDIGLI